MKKNDIKVRLDDVRPINSIYYTHDYDCIAAHSVNEAKRLIVQAEQNGQTKFLLDLDHDLGEYANDGGDGYKLVEWLIETDRNTGNYLIQCHSMNPVGKEHILGLYKRYWKGV